LRLRFISDSPTHLGSLYIRAASPHADLVEEIVTVVQRDRALLNDLLRVGQYDLSEKSLRGRVKRNLKKLRKSLRVKESSIVKMSSGTELIGIAVFFALEKLLTRYNLYMYLEPEIIVVGSPFDYAIVDEANKRVLLLVEVKRLRSFENLPRYAKNFLDKAMPIIDRCGYAVLHLHITPDIAKDEKLLDVVKTFAETLNTMIRISMNVRVILTYGDSFDLFRKQLEEQIEALLTS